MESTKPLQAATLGNDSILGKETTKTATTQISQLLANISWSSRVYMAAAMKSIAEFHGLPNNTFTGLADHVIHTSDVR